ncbi:MAG: hypothetical protein EBS83_07780 [Planctomycetia bacterium]|nr:hypothetical protein [Planctomycetia bacterium]
MAGVNVKRVGTGTPERRQQLLYGKSRHPVGLSLAGIRTLVLIGGFLPPGGSWWPVQLTLRKEPTSCRRVAVR